MIGKEALGFEIITGLEIVIAGLIMKGGEVVVDGDVARSPRAEADVGQSPVANSPAPAVGLGLFAAIGHETGRADRDVDIGIIVVEVGVTKENLGEDDKIKSEAKQSEEPEDPVLGKLPDSDGILETPERDHRGRDRSGIRCEKLGDRHKRRDDGGEVLEAPCVMIPSQPNRDDGDHRGKQRKNNDNLNIRREVVPAPEIRLTPDLTGVAPPGQDRPDQLLGIGREMPTRPQLQWPSTGPFGSNDGV